MLLKRILLLSLICCSFTLMAQDSTYKLRPTPKPFLNKFFNKTKYNPAYIEDYTWNLNVRLMNLNKTNHFQFRRSRFRPGVDYTTNESTHLGVFANWQWLGIGVYLKLPESEAEKKKKGSTEGYDIYFNAYGRKFGIDANFQQYSGYYLKAITSQDTNVASGGVYPQRSDILTQSLLVNLHYVVNHDKFSFRATFNQTEIQKRSAGSVVINPFFSYYRIESDSALVPDQFKRLYPDDLELAEGQFYSLGLSVGYAYTLVYRQWFASACVFPGVSLQLQDYTTTGKEYKNRIAPGTKIQTRFCIGYNGKKFVASIQAFGDAQVVNLKVTELRNQIGNVRLSVGYRFGKWKPYL